MPRQGDAKQRLHEMLDRTYSRFREFEPHYARLLKALAVVYGIEPMVILNDICGASDRETRRWCAG